MRKIIFISVFMVLFFSVANAQQNNTYNNDTTRVIVDEKKYTDEEEVVVTNNDDMMEVDTTLFYHKLRLPADSVEAWKNRKEFAYTKYLDSLLKAQKDQKPEEKKQETPAPSSSDVNWLGKLFSSVAVKFLLWAAAISFVLFLLYKLFLTEGVFRKNTMAANTNQSNVEEEIITSESDFDVLIRQAVQQGNFRLAIRYQYLRTLHKLAGKNLVELAADKTNYQYVREISNQNYQNDFAKLTLNYEYVWYGNFVIEENIYSRMEPEFSLFNNRL